MNKFVNFPRRNGKSFKLLNELNKKIKKSVLDNLIDHSISTYAANPIEVPKLTVESLKDAIKLTKDLIKLDIDGVEYLQLKLLNNIGVKDGKERK